VSIRGLNLVSARLETSARFALAGAVFFGPSWYGGGAKEDPLASIRGWAGASRNQRYVGFQHEGQTLFGLVGTGARKYGSVSRRNKRSHGSGNSQGHGFPDSGHHSHSFTRRCCGSHLAKRVLADINSALAAAAMKTAVFPGLSNLDMT